MLTGFIAVDQLILATADEGAHLFTASGDLVESIDLQAGLPGPIERLGQVDGRAVIQSNGLLFRSDAEFAGFEPWAISPSKEIRWSAPSPPDAAELTALDAAWRGRGLTVERMVLDLHSGRIFDMPGVLLMDLVALCMIVLGLSGLMLSNSRYRRENGTKSAKRD